MSFYVWETHIKYARQCQECNHGMNDGYLNEETGHTFHSDDCAMEFYDVNRHELEDMLCEEVLIWTEWEESE